jgi:hypothetical protein
VEVSVDCPAAASGKCRCSRCRVPGFTSLASRRRWWVRIGVLVCWRVDAHVGSQRWPVGMGGTGMAAGRRYLGRIDCGCRAMPCGQVAVICSRVSQVVRTPPSRRTLNSSVLRWVMTPCLPATRTRSPSSTGPVLASVQSMTAASLTMRLTSRSVLMLRLRRGGYGRRFAMLDGRLREQQRGPWLPSSVGRCLWLGSARGPEHRDVAIRPEPICRFGARHETWGRYVQPTMLSARGGP